MTREGEKQENKKQTYAWVLSCFSCVQLFATPWTVALQAPLSIGFSRQEYWNGLSCPPPGDLPKPGIKAACPALVGGSLPLAPPGKPCYWYSKFLSIVLESSEASFLHIHIISTQSSA